MIIDTLENSKKYHLLNSRFETAFNFLSGLRGTLDPGRHEIDGDNVFALVQTYESRAEDTMVYEVHQKYIDIQFVVSGRETIFWAPLSTVEEETMAFDVDQDVGFYKLTENKTPLRLEAGCFAIFYPCDAHAPGGIWDSTKTIHKVVIKVRL